MSSRWSEGWGRSPQVQASEQALRTDSPHHAGRNIGLCNRKLHAMSGEEVESMEQNKLAEHVGKVGSSQGLAGAAGRRRASSFTAH